MMRRRDRRRQETIDDIKDTARNQLASAGPAGISMRSIARHLAMTASAVHYYFPSRQALLDALIVDGFTSLAWPCGLPTRGQVRAHGASSGSPYASIMRGAVAADEIDTERIEAATPASLRRQFVAWRDEDDGGGDLPDGALAACMITYAQLHGAITLELLGHVPPALADHGALFGLEMVHAYAALCRQPFS
jgi:AcrR family transcriptional regulator